MANSQQEHSLGVRQGSDIAFERSAYIDGVSYLLRGLPGELDEAETTVLRRALPVPLVDPSAAPAPRCGHHPRICDLTRQSALHRWTRRLVANIIVWFFVAWPYIVSLIQRIAHYERKHKVSERVVERGMELANACTRRGADVSESVCRMGDGRVGQALTDRLSWAIQGVTGGLSDGVEEGWSRVGARRKKMI